jgi:hypothetical protein
LGELFASAYSACFGSGWCVDRIVENILSKKVTEEDLAIYRLKCREARFLFDGPVLEFIHEIEHTIKWWYVTGEDNKEQYLKFFEPLLSRPRGSGGVLDPKYTLEGQFKPYLVQAPVKRPWLLRWLRPPR